MHPSNDGQVEPTWDANAWRTRARRVVDDLCKAAYASAVAEAKKQRRKRIDYRVPDDATALIGFLNKDDEEGAKALMLCLNFYEVEKRRDDA